MELSAAEVAAADLATLPGDGGNGMSRDGGGGGGGGTGGGGEDGGRGGDGVDLRREDFFDFFRLLLLRLPSLFLSRDRDREGDGEWDRDFVRDRRERDRDVLLLRPFSLSLSFQCRSLSRSFFFDDPFFCNHQSHDNE